MPPATEQTILVVDNDVFTEWRSSQDCVKRALQRYYSYHKQLPILTAITVFDSLRGFRRALDGAIDARQAETFGRLQQLIDDLVVLPFDGRAAQIAAQIFPRLRGGEQAPLAASLFVASIALANGCGVATLNKKDFETVEAALPGNLGPLYVAVWR